MILSRFIRNRTQIIYIALWIMVVIIHFFILYFTYHLRPQAAFLDSFVFNLLYALLGLGLWFMVRFSDLRKKAIIEIIGYHLTGCTVTVLIWYELGYLLLSQLLRNDTFYTTFLNSSTAMRIFSGILYYALLVSIYYLLINLRELKEKMEKEATLTALLKEAQLNMLRSQIRPHFLFNSLNSISSLTMTNPGKAQEMVIKLSEFMRYSLSFQDTLMSILEKELYHIDLYLEIEKVRFGDRLKVEKNITENSMAWRIPAMILQPVIENAVKYGVYESTGLSTISISAIPDGGYLMVTIRNNFDPAGMARKGTGTGLKNIEGRLLAIYNRNDLMKITKTETTFELELKFPPDEES
jgi:two-component system LytT family sensor kinase